MNLDPDFDHAVDEGQYNPYVMNGLSLEGTVPFDFFF
jgi:hypothetical protein